ncbi:hypothetical protein ANTPLA_LOCUS10980 [Anthophora plagiata]
MAEHRGRGSLVGSPRSFTFCCIRASRSGGGTTTTTTTTTTFSVKLVQCLSTRCNNGAPVCLYFRRTCTATTKIRSESVTFPKSFYTYFHGNRNIFFLFSLYDHVMREVQDSKLRNKEMTFKC